MPVIPIDHDDIPAGRELRTEFARFWSTARGQPRDIYDRFIGSTPTTPGVIVDQPTNDLAPGFWVRPGDAQPDRAVLFIHGGGYGQGSAEAYAGFVSQIVARSRVPAFVLDYPLAPESRLPEALDLAVATLKRLLDGRAAVAVVGDSAGGGDASARAQSSRYRRDSARRLDPVRRRHRKSRWHSATGNLAGYAPRLPAERRAAVERSEGIGRHGRLSEDSSVRLTDTCGV
jgi:acetyl esterase/lipase